MSLAASARALVVGPGPVRPGLGPGASVVASDLASALAARGVDVVAVDSSPTSALLWTRGPRVRYLEPLDSATLRRIAEAERVDVVVAHAAGPIVVRAVAVDRWVGSDLVDATREAPDDTGGALVDVVAASDGRDAEILAALSASAPHVRVGREQRPVALADSEHRVLRDVPPELAAAVRLHLAAEPVIGLVTLRCVERDSALEIAGDRVDPAAWPVAGLVRGVRPGALLGWLLLGDPLAEALRRAAVPRRAIEARVPCFDFDPYPGADRALGARAKSLGATLRGEPLAVPPPPAGRRVLIVGPGPVRAGHGAEASLATLLAAREAARLGHEVIVATTRDGTGVEAHAVRVHVTSDYDVTIRAEAPTDLLLGFGADPCALAALAARSTDVGAGAAAVVPPDRPAQDAVEVHVVVLSDGARAKIVGTFEHVERAAVHPADAAAVSPSLRVDEVDLRAAEERALELAPRLGVRGLYTAELAVSARSSERVEAGAGRGVALTGLTAGVTTHALSLGLSASVDVVAEALRLALGEPLGGAPIPQPRHVAVEEHVFAFAALGASDTRLDRRPRSTGSVLGLGESVARAYAGALSAMTEHSLALRRPGPAGASAILLAGAEAHAVDLADVGRRLYALGFDVVATEQAACWLERARVPHRRTSDAAELVARRGVVAAVSTGEDSAVRRAALVAGVTCFTTVDLVKVTVKALELDDAALARVTSLEARG